MISNIFYSGSRSVPKARPFCKPKNNNVPVETRNLIVYFLTSAKTARTCPGADVINHFLHGVAKLF